jgi:hypothetical protein
MDTQVVINKVTNLPDPNDPAAVAEAAASSSWASSFIGEDEDENEPMSGITYPIINSINDVTIDRRRGTRCWALLSRSTGVTLSRTFCHLIPRVSLSSSRTCNQVFTYRIDGENAIYVGQGDQHDSKYDSLGVSSTLTELRNSSDSSRGSAYQVFP